MYAGGSNMHLFNPDTLTWMKISDFSGVPPTKRILHGFTALQGKLFVHGGFRKNGAGSSFVIPQLLH
jgi:hypothetical protein